MSCTNHNTQPSHSDPQEYSYHLEQAHQFLQYAEQAQQDMDHAMAHFHRHNAWLKEYSNKTFIA